MTDTDLRMIEINKRLTYKPGYMLSIGINPNADFYNAVMTFYAPDTDDPKYTVLTKHKEVLGKKADVANWTDVQICEALLKFIMICEEHEAREWIKLDGQKVINPHEDKKA